MSRVRVIRAESHLFCHFVSVLIGEVDEAIDAAADLSSIRADPLPPIRY